MRGERELTWTAVALGAALAVVFGAANAYLGLRVGMTVSASIPASVVSMGLLRFVFRRDSILENNMVQTIGSAGEAVAAGVIFTVPGIYLWASEGLCAPPGFWYVTVVALAGGVLGVLMLVPLRRPLVVDEEAALPYPEGRACAEILKAGERGARHAKGVLAGAVAAAALKVATDALRWLPAKLALPVRAVLGELGLDVSPALAGVGFIVGPRISTLCFSGAFLGWMVLIPLCCCLSERAAELYAQGGAVAVWKSYVRYVGAGAIATGGFISLFRSAPAFARAFWKSVRSVGAADAARADERDRDLPLERVLLAAGAVVAGLAAAPCVPMGAGGALLVALFGFFFAAVSARMVGIVGASNNPASGMTIATLVVATLAYKATGRAGAAGMVAVMTVGAVVCLAAATVGDVVQDLKTGRLVGATPWKQQVGGLVGAVVAAFSVAGVMLLFDRTWGFGSEAIPAPQATMMKVVVEGIMSGDLPWGCLGVGAALACAVALLRVPVMPFAIGIYLPVRLMATLFLGGLARLWVDRRRPAAADGGTLAAAGLIAGEGVTGIVLAVLALFL